MIPALHQYPRFEKGSPSTEYQQIINFCVNYLEGMLVGLIHMDIPAEIESQSSEIKELQKRMISRERTIRHAFQFQIEKYFSDFKSISRPRLRVNHAYPNVGISDHKSARVLDIIDSIGVKHQNLHKTQLQNTGRRLKTLVHRLDENNDDNPISPVNLGRAFLASIETLNLSTQKNHQLFILFDFTLEEQLDIFYNQIDLGLYYLGILTELTDSSLFLQPEIEEAKNDPDSDKTTGSELESETANYTIDEKAESSAPEELDPVVTSLQGHIEKSQDKQVEIDEIIQEFKFNTENGTLNLFNLFAKLEKQLGPLVTARQGIEMQKFVHFYSSLLNNTMLTTALKTQLSRLSCPLLQMVLIDPFFFRSSSHPVNDFIQSIIDFELRFKHEGESLLKLSQLIDDIHEIKQPGLSDYQPLIDRYETFKKAEVERLEQIKEEKLRREEELKDQILQLVNEITAQLVVDQETLQFFYEDWQLLLLHIAQKQGADSAEYNNSVNIAKMLCWFLDVNTKGFHPEFESISFKSLLTSVEIGLVTLNYSSEHRHRTRKQLVKEYKQANEKESFTVIPSVQKRETLHGLQLAHDNSKNPETHAIELANSLNMGDWVEIKSATDKKFSRAKLKWRAADSSLFIFIDQYGHKIKECDLTELEQDFINCSIKLLKKPTFKNNLYF